MLPHSHWQQKCQHTTRASAGWQKKNARKKFGMIFHFAFFFSISFSSFFSLNLWGIKEESSFHCVDCCWGGFFFSAPSLLCVLCFGDCERKVQMMKHFVIFAMRKRQGGKGGVGDEGGGWKSLWGWPYGKNKYFILFSAPLFLPSYERSESTASEAAVNEQVSRVVGDDTAEDKPFVRNTR